MKLSIVILCWNDRKVISDCLRSIYATTLQTEFEIIVADNGSTDGSVEEIRRDFPSVRIIENGRNLRFAKGNNVAIRASRGEYVLILNPDTIIHEGTLDGMVKFADEHPESGAFGCRVLNRKGEYWVSARPTHTLRAEWCTALGLGFLAYLSEWFNSGTYVGWSGDTQRTVGWLAGCFILVNGDLVRRLGGFDEQFFYYYEDTDLCRRIWDAGYPILYNPTFSIVHLGGQSTINRFNPTTFALDAEVTRYRYFYKYYGTQGVKSCRWASLVALSCRRLAYRLAQLARPSESKKKRIEMLSTLLAWNQQVDPVRLVEHGEEPDLGLELADRVTER